MLVIVHLVSGFDQRPNRLNIAFDGSRQLIDILWLDDSLEIVFEDFGEVIFAESAYVKEEEKKASYFVAQNLGSISRSLPNLAGCHNVPGWASAFH